VTSNSVRVSDDVTVESLTAGIVRVEWNHNVGR
jgi:hypothetical protein